MVAFIRGMLWHLLTAGRSHIFFKKGNDCIVDSKRYVRALKRRPVKVLYPDSETTCPTSKQRSDQIGNKQSQTVVSTMRESTVNDYLKNETTDRVFSMSWSTRNGKAFSTSEHTTNLKDQLGGPKFERVTKDCRKRVVSVACSRMFREHQAKILLEGRRLICNSLAAGANPHMVFFSSVDTLCELSLDKLKRAILVKVKFEDIKIWSDLVVMIFEVSEPYFQGNTGLVIGGETHGLSLEAVQLAERTAGQRLFIPVVPGVDSLNSAMAASILLFEGRRQLLNLMETSGRKASSKVQVPF
uniref:tRNA/rRNA methyltransferase SpoU type domain-containing protein n=1 Tax=Hucho hucho TaxID=62062 RepID=A0A4W5MBQ1_9TELE